MSDYVYLWCYPDGTPFYVGVGSHRSRRVQWPLRNPLCDSIRAKIERDGGEVKIDLRHMPDRESALQEERRLIALYGRRDISTGILANLTDGGERGGNCGPETRAKISAARRGTKASDETRAKQSAVRRGRKSSPEAVAKRVATYKSNDHSELQKRRRVEALLRYLEKGDRHVTVEIASNKLRYHARQPSPTPVGHQTIQEHLAQLGVPLP